VFTISKLRRVSDPTHPPAGRTRAIVKSAWVTAVKTVSDATNKDDLGFFIQEGSALYSGIFVFTEKTVPTVKVGNRVEIEGDYEERNSLSQLTRPTVKVLAETTTLPAEIAPVVIDPAVYASTANRSAAGEPWESMLCVVNGPITVSKMNADETTPPAEPVDHDEFMVTSSNLRVDDYLDVEPLKNDYPVGTSFERIVGICGFSFSNRKIWPRSVSELVQ